MYVGQLEDNDEDFMKHLPLKSMQNKTVKNAVLRCRAKAAQIKSDRDAAQRHNLSLCHT